MSIGLVFNFILFFLKPTRSVYDPIRLAKMHPIKFC